ncbi:hypothetical protein [Pseudogulbenkiania subflava]|uniref:DUF3987 domain-containing protein n=1 Tax=Pseudogulbenkiania subflava DSM 22618 TaxID=1123014 RepID=A0A1Y6CBF5_9NEIS|nr:hypothetical protein [Pseudogulbenkiania subflava]SMF53423.1 hypothetical protein SAMN02745746_03817 [Pseudogulbenkiania subflava DSM 22618]
MESVKGNAPREGRARRAKGTDAESEDITFRRELKKVRQHLKSTDDDPALRWLYCHAPPGIKHYMNFFMDNSLCPHPAYAMISALFLMQSLFGRQVVGPHQNRMNLWLLFLAPTESGKGDIFKLAKYALKEIGAMRTDNRVPLSPSIPHAERRFGSAEGLWWLLAEKKQVIWADPEFGQTLGRLIAAQNGTHDSHIKGAIIDAYDGAEEETIQPTHYSQRNKNAEKMPPLHFPFFSIVGTGVPENLKKITADASEEGLLNRFLVVAVEEAPDGDGALGDYAPLPDRFLKWLQREHVVKALTRFFQGELVGGDFYQPITLPCYDGINEDWQENRRYGAAMARKNPGVWGRFAQKILKLATIYAMADNGCITREGFMWARNFVLWTIRDFERQFQAQGGGAENEMDALGRAFLSVFDAPSLKGREPLPMKVFSQYSRKWAACKDRSTRWRVLEALMDDGLIKEENGGFRRLRD